MILEVSVKAGARVEKVEPDGPGRYKIWVRAIAERGRANEAVIKALSEHLAVPKSRLELLSGHTAPRKRLRLL